MSCSQEQVTQLLWPLGPDRQVRWEALQLLICGCAETGVVFTILFTARALFVYCFPRGAAQRAFLVEQYGEYQQLLLAQQDSLEIITEKARWDDIEVCLLLQGRRGGISLRRRR